MPYKDKVQQRKYQRKWAYNKRNGLETKTCKVVPKMTKDKILKNSKIAKKKLRDKKKNIKKKYCGESCYFCGNKERLICHRKDGKYHKELLSFRLKDLEEELKSGKYINLCFYCHKCVHWTMKYFKFSWNKITEIYSKRM